jgi:hypothetical protein
MLVIVQAANRRFRLGVATHFDKTETLAAAGLSVRNHLRALNFAKFRENLLEIRAAHPVGQIAYV